MQRNKNSDSYVKFLAVIDIIIKHSDRKNPLTISDIRNYLYAMKYNFDLDYRAVKRFVQYYNDYYNEDVIINYKEGRNNYFYFTNDVLDSMEAKAILDLVYSSDFFTNKTKENYKKKIQGMFTIHYQSYFNKVLNNNIQKNANSNVFYNELGLISEAIVNHKKINFKYHKPSITNEVEKEHTLAPIDTMFSNNVYYLLCQGARNPEDLLSYRMDYINDVQITNEDFALSPYEIEQFQRKLQMISYMYGEGQEEPVVLEFSEEVYPNMIDKFGKNLHPIAQANGCFRVSVRATINSTFYSWIIGFGGKIKIVDTPNQVQRFKDFLQQNFVLEGE